MRSPTVRGRRRSLAGPTPGFPHDESNGSGTRVLLDFEGKVPRDPSQLLDMRYSKFSRSDADGSCVMFLLGPSGSMDQNTGTLFRGGLISAGKMGSGTASVGDR